MSLPTSLGSPSPPVVHRRRRTLSSFLWNRIRSPPVSSDARRNAAISSNPRVESFVPASPDIDQAHISRVGTGESQQSSPSAPVINPVTASHVVVSQARACRAQLDVLQNLTEDDTSDANDGTDLAAAILNSYSDPAQGTDRNKPYSAILVYREEREMGSAVEQPVRYLPLEQYGASRKSVPNMRVQSHYARRIRNIDHAVLPSRVPWPSGTVPAEIFELISQSLERDDVMAMRLVNHEFETKVSRTLFQTCVVPFNTELYDMIDDTAKRGTRACLSGASQPSSARDSVQWINAKDDTDGKVYRGHGLRVFQGFGPHIKRFGMRFEVAQDQLSRPPVKRGLDTVDSYHGCYNWPPPHYTRYANLAGLERTADETSRMKAAFSNLTSVKELALSIDSGLGWLSGPDPSLRARLYKRPTSVFKSARTFSSKQFVATVMFWDALQQSQRSMSSRGIDPREVILEYRPIASSVQNTVGRFGRRITDTRNWPVINLDNVVPDRKPEPPFAGDHRIFGVLCTTPGLHDDIYRFHHSINPTVLKKEQKEWLLEMDWAQRAFLESYMLAVVDNGSIFRHVTTLHIAKMSSRFIQLIANESFWRILRCLKDVTLLVSPDWRTVGKDDAGVAVIPGQRPSNAVDLFHCSLLQQHVSIHSNIVRLNIGWVGGGEHAEGSFARNNHVLPAPITLLKDSLASVAQHCMIFPRVEFLTLTNCWLSPPTLESLLSCHADQKLLRLTLDSVSLTAHPGVPAPVNLQGVAMHLQPIVAGAGNMQNPAVLAAARLRAGLQAGGQGGLLVPLPDDPNGVPPRAPHNASQAQHFIYDPAVRMLNHGGVAPPPVSLPPSHFTAGHRAGSWPDVINRYSPGVIIGDGLPPRGAVEGLLPRRPSSSLLTIEFRSCGHVIFDAPQSFDQSMLEEEWSQRHVPSPWFHVRSATLKPHMMSSRDPVLGRIPQYLPPRELDVLKSTWGLTTGWQEGAEEPTWDGMRPGGTGRFTGSISRSVP